MVEKKIHMAWIHAVQTSAVQGSAILGFLDCGLVIIMKVSLHDEGMKGHGGCETPIVVPRVKPSICVR